ncbi:MAG TPA: ABC transporter permease [Acidobacteriota bacterium]|nr:ABC transporter permease [Acidobacteriota bacterium]
MNRTKSTLIVAARAIGRNKLRSILTMLGIIIGVACVVATIGIGEGAKAQIESQLNALGTNFLMIFPGAATSSGARGGWGTNSKLSYDDVVAIRKECTNCAYVTAQNRASSQVVYGNQNWSTLVTGGEIDWPAVRSWNLESGQFFTDADNRVAAKVCVIGKTVQKELFLDEDPVGKTIRIRELPFKVIGVLETKGGSVMGQDQDDIIVAPYETVRKKLLGTTAVGMVMVSAISNDRVDAVQDEVTALLRQRHKLGMSDDDDFMIRSQTDMLQQADMQSRTLSILLWSIAGVSLLVGGIGIMNIMLVSVTERTREIGTRMAIGAKPGDIRSQFLIEALTLALCGGLLGIGTGYFIEKAVARFGDWPVSMQPSAMALAFFFSVLIGVFFGFYPAFKASQLDPIDALRHE